MTSQTFSPVVDVVLRYFLSAEYVVMAIAEGSMSGYLWMFGEKKTYDENRLLHAASALVMIVEREIEWGHEVNEMVMDYYRVAASWLEKYGRTEWENVPIPTNA